MLTLAQLLGQLGVFLTFRNLQWLPLLEVARAIESRATVPRRGRYGLYHTTLYILFH
jgi:hypothetical protein